ncbi:MAG: protein kinase domain-containing protein [Elainellaceae cyanobacterium]
MTTRTRYLSRASQGSVGLQIGQRLHGRYRITKLLGRGGFSETYVANDQENLDAPTCVVKHLNPLAFADAIAPQEAHTRFQQEAEMLELLGRHDQIPQLLNYLEEEGQSYLVQEWIDGRSLHTEFVSSQSWSEPQVIEFLQELLTVLAFVHQHGVIHRDIKPENIIRRQSDHRLVLIDFGSAKPLSSERLEHPEKRDVERADIPKTMTVAICSHGYAPAEQLYGQPCLASDIYAVGMVAIQAWTGRHPKDFEGTTFTETEWWRERSRIHPSLAEILQRMTHRDWKRRYSQASQCLHAILSLSSNDSNANPSIRPSSYSNSNSSNVSNSDTAADHNGAIEGLGYTPTQMSKPAQRADWAITIPPLELHPDPSETPLLSSQFSLSVDESADGVSSPSTYSFATLRQLPFRLQVGGRALLRRCGIYYPARFIRVSVSACLISSSLPFFLWLLYGVMISSSQREVLEQTQSVEPPPVLHSFNSTSPILAIAPGRQANTLFTANGDKTISMWNLASGQIVQRLEDHFGAVTALALSSGTHRLASGSNDTNIKIWDTLTGEQVQTLRDHHWPILAIAFAADGKTVVSSSQDNTLRIWNSETGELLKVLSEGQAPILALDVSPDGSLLLAGSSDNTVQVWNLYSGTLLMTLRGHAAPVHGIAVSLNGAVAVSGSADQTAKVWNLYTGELIQTFDGHRDEVWTVAISPDGQTVATGGKSGSINVWNLYSGEQTYVFRNFQSENRALTFSHDGRALIGAFLNGEVKVWQLPSELVPKGA